MASYFLRVRTLGRIKWNPDFLILWQIIFYGYARPGDERAINATNFYPRSYLMGISIFWLGLIAFVIWRLWVQFPGH
jgi:hypothetical protein